jgi:hypothetical protein
MHHSYQVWLHLTMWCQRMDDRYQVIAIADMTIWVRWAKLEAHLSLNHSLSKHDLELLYILNVDLSRLEPNSPWDLYWYKIESSYHNSASQLHLHSCFFLYWWWMDNWRRNQNDDSTRMIIHGFCFVLFCY